MPPRYNLRKPKTPGTEEDKPADLRSEMMAAAAARAARSPGSLDTTESSDSRGGTTRPEHLVQPSCPGRRLLLGV